MVNGTLTVLIATGIESDASSAPNEVENKYHERNYEQKVNEATGDMESESTAPKEQKNNSKK